MTRTVWDQPSPMRRALTARLLWRSLTPLDRRVLITVAVIALYLVAQMPRAVVA